MTIKIEKISSRYRTRYLNENDIAEIQRIMSSNPLFYEYTLAQHTSEAIAEDMKTLPPGKKPADKHYFGFFDGGRLIAVMDLIDGYPDEDTAFIGFFMLDADLQGRGIGTAIISETCEYLQKAGFAVVRLCINKGNPQSSSFWAKNGFVQLEERKRGEETVILAERRISIH